MELNIQEIAKKDINNILNEDFLWNNPFLIGAKHRLFAHSNNKSADEDDIILLIAYWGEQIIGYMGTYMDKIHFNDKSDKIAWLSTWWLHPDSAGKGIGKAMLERVHTVHNGKIGISQFTPSARRVYDKSGYFNYLNKLVGCKIDLRLNLTGLLPQLKKSLNNFIWLFKIFDNLFNPLINIKLKLVYNAYFKSLKSYKIDYLTYIDQDMEFYVLEKQKNNLCIRGKDFFESLKTHQWIEESPLLELVSNKSRYFFSSYNKNFNIYLVKVQNSESDIVGFFVLLRKDKELKVLQIYYEKKESVNIAKLIIMHGIKLGISTIITYDEQISRHFKQLKYSRIRYKKKERESIISKVYGKIGFDSLSYQYGDGDCSFA